MCEIPVLEPARMEAPELFMAVQLPRLEKMYVIEEESLLLRRCPFFRVSLSEEDILNKELPL